MSTLKPASTEQLNVIAQLEHTNVIVDAVAGSGKTTTVLHIASSVQVSVLLIAYNRKLGMETKQRAKSENIKNLDVYTYHGFCCSRYEFCPTDKVITKITDENTAPRFCKSYDVIILDECQDMTPIYYRLVHKIIVDNGKIPKICVMGDRNQSIYDYNKADSRFIIFADKLFANDTFSSWSRCNLSISYRVTTPMANFINDCILGHERIVALKTGVLPKYIIYNNHMDCYDEIVSLLNTYLPQDIFVIAPSVKSARLGAKCETPVRQLANELSKDGIAIYVSDTAADKVDDDITRDKIVFTTFHQAKGLERKVVIVYGFDSSYFEFYERKKSQLICPNVLYVALTRAQERLILFHAKNKDFLPFMNCESLSDYCQVIGKISKSKLADTQCATIQVTQLVTHLPCDVMMGAMKYIEYKQTVAPHYKIDIPCKTKQSKTYEAVSEITGTAIPAYYELLKHGRMEIFTDCKSDATKKATKKLRDVKISKLRRELAGIKLTSLSTVDLLRIATFYCAIGGGYTYKLHQITDYSWLSSENLALAITSLSAEIDDKRSGLYFEVKVAGEMMNKTIIGRIDCVVDVDTVYEFKCTTELTDEHKLQLAVYAYLYGDNVSLGTRGTTTATYKLFNILTGEICILSADHETLARMVEYIIKCKYYDYYDVCDADFLDKAIELRDGYDINAAIDWIDADMISIDEPVLDELLVDADLCIVESA